MFYKNYVHAVVVGKKDYITSIFGSKVSQQFNYHEIIWWFKKIKKLPNENGRRMHQKFLD